MDVALIDHIACPVCQSRFELDGDPTSEGTLSCTGCPSTFPISGGVPRLIGGWVSEEQTRTAAAFGWEWKHFVEQYEVFEPEFLGWVQPLGPDDFAGKDVLDAGCGTGRHMYFAAKYGANRVIGMDLGVAVETATLTTQKQPNAHVVQGDILNPPFEQADGAFDLIYSIGVLHHMPDPKQGFLSLARFLRPGGRIAIWVYGHEGNGFVRWTVEPLRRLTSKMPPSLMRVIALPLACLFFLLTKGVYGPTRRWKIGRALPMRGYMTHAAHTFGFRHGYSVVFDQLVAPRTHYIRREQLDDWYKEAGLESLEVSFRTGNSWRACGSKPAAVATPKPAASKSLDAAAT